MKRNLRLGTLLSVAVLVQGCSMGRQIGDFSIDYNRAVARSRNEMLLLNIVRASRREPLQFSTVSSVVGTLELSGTLDAPTDKLIEWRKDGSANKASFSPKLSLSASSKPTFTVQPLADKDFTTQIATPIPPATIAHLMGQNWSPTFLFPLILMSVSCKVSGKDTTFRNTFRSTDTALADLFTKQVFDVMLTSTPKYALIIDSAKIDPAVLIEHLGKIGGDQYEMADIRKTPDGLYNISLKSKTKDWAVTGFPADSGLPLDCLNDNKVAVSSGSGDVRSSYGTIQFRSVESVIYYLGEALREGHALTFVDHCIPQDDQSLCSGTGAKTIIKTLFDVKTGRPTAPAAVETDYAGTHYWIPAYTEKSNDRTLSTLSLVSQLVALQTVTDVSAIPQPVIAVGGR